MTELNPLRKRIEQLETEIESVLDETEKLQRTLGHKVGARLAHSLFPALLLGACWSLATPQGNSTISQVHAPFEVDDSSGQKIFRVNNDHAFYVYTEKGTLALVAQASQTDTSLMVAPGDGGPWVKLGLDGSASQAPVASTAASQQAAGRKGRDRGHSQRPGGAGQGGGAGGAMPGMVPFLKLSPGGQSKSKERIVLDMKDGKPEFTMRNTSGVEVFDLLQAQAFPGGELGLFNGSGTLAVRAGSSQSGVGRVQAFPLGNPIGSSIAGRIR